MTQRLALLASLASGMAKEDPALLAAQVSRRYLSGRVRHQLANLGAHVPEGVIRDICGLLADRPDLMGCHGRYGARAQAREFWDRGEIDAALGTLKEGDSLHTRLLDEWRLLSDCRMVLPPAPDAGSRRNDTALPKNPVDVLHFLNNSPPHTQSGYTVRTQRLLTAQRDAGLAVAAATRVGYPVVTGSFGAPYSDIVDGIEYHRLLPRSLPRLPRPRLVHQGLELQHLATRLRPRVLHTTTDFKNALAVQAVAESLHVPWVYEMRGQLERTWVARHAPELQQQLLDSPRYRAWRDAETRMAHRADAVLVLSETQKSDMEERGIAPERLTVVPNAFDWPTDRRRLSKAEARAILGLPDDRVWVGSISAVVDYEGFDTLVRALALAHRDGLAVSAALVGDGVALPQVRHLARRLGVDDLLVTPGRVPVEDSHIWYQALDLFAVPRRDTPVCHTVTPIKPLEAMASATPLLVSDLPALRELIGADAGLAVAPDDPRAWADAIASLPPSSSRYATMSRAARRRAARGGWAQNARLCGDVYARILK